MPKEPANVDLKTAVIFRRKGYRLENKLSAGAFGQVYTAKLTSGEGVRAVKVMDLNKYSEKFKEKFLPRELTVLTTVRHDNIIRVYDIFRSNHKIYIFMEFAPNGTLFDYCKRHSPLSETLVKVWFGQLCDALYFLHSDAKIAHRDIKLDNILLDGNNVPKFTDFGFAREIKTDENGKLELCQTFCGTEPYYSPQVNLLE